MRQFTFICLVAEVNTVHSLARGKHEATKPQLEFRRKLAKQMMTNMIDVHVVPDVVECPAPAFEVRYPKGIVESVHPLLPRGEDRLSPSSGWYMRNEDAGLLLM